MNIWFDGDTCALYLTHSIDALQEMHDNAFIKNTITYDVNNEMLSVIRHEALYCGYIMTKIIDPTIGVDDPFEIDDLQNLPENDDLYNKYLYYAVKFKDKLYTYGTCLFNKWCGFSEPFIKFVVYKQTNNLVSRVIHHIFKDNEIYYLKLTELNKKLLYFISMTEHCPSINIEEMLNLVPDETEKLFKKLPDSHPVLGYYINEALIDRCIANLDKNTDLYNLYKSGSRFNKQQLARSCICVG